MQKTANLCIAHKAINDDAKKRQPNFSSIQPTSLTPCLVIQANGVEFPQTSVFQLCLNHSCVFYNNNMVYKAVMQGEKMRKGPWYREEDKQLITFVTLLGDRKWDYIARVSGIKRCGKSCRLRWLNYLRPNIKHGDISIEEEQIILQLHEQWGNKWARIARSLPGRTDNEIKNYWRTHLRRKIMQAREQENFQCEREDGKQDFLPQKVDFDVQTYEAGEHKPVDETSGTSNTSLDALGFSSSAVTNSPYEVRFFDWDYNCTESCISYTSRNSDDNDVWGWSDSIWDMN